MNFRNPELQRLLDNLNNASKHSTQTGALDSNPDSAHALHSLNQSVDPRLRRSRQDFTISIPESQDGPVSNPTAAAHSTITQQAPASLKPSDSQSRSITPSTQPISDASTITTWPAAVKHVARHIVNDDKATTRIKHLIRQQQQHEEQWWTQREAIVAKHKGRVGSNNKVADILKELGGLAVPMAKVDDAADKNELEMFDKKVYRSLVQLAADFDGQLRKLGVPFYAVKHDLIFPAKESDKDVATGGKLDKGELRELQKRMLHYLEDLLLDD